MEKRSPVRGLKGTPYADEQQQKRGDEKKVELEEENGMRSNISMALFAKNAAQVLRPLPFVNRDAIANLILMTDGVFGNMTGVLAVVSMILNMANLVLSSLPFGALIPVLIQIVLHILMSPQTRFFAKYLLYRIWILIPATENDVYQVYVVDQNVIVTPAGESEVLLSSPAPFRGG